MNGLSFWEYFKQQYKLWNQVFSGEKFGNIQYFRKIPSETYVKYPPHETFHGKRVLNIGCGRCVYRTSNVVNTDLQKGDGVNIILDLSQPPFPFDTNEFDIILANHVLEHVPNWWECFKELGRILKQGGKMEVWIPPLSSDSSFTYRDHINRIGPCSFAGIDGCSGRNTTNLTAREDYANFNFVDDLRLLGYQQRPILKWWCWFAPEPVLNWMSEHLRNIISEEGYLFTKKEKKNVSS